jgi:putative Mg2+ transporter-C (MgtC) family protein
LPSIGPGKVIDYPEIALRLILAILLGGLIGMERETAHKPAGLRTNILVCLGTTLFILVAIVAFDDYPESPIDITRVAAGIIVGIGFLGGGTILRTDRDIQGLTSAATIWFVCAIGMANGMGYYFLAIPGALLGFVVLRFVPLLERKFLQTRAK